MTRTSWFLLHGLSGLLIFTACSPASTPVVPTSRPSPTAEIVYSFPTPAPSGEVIVYDDLQVVMKEAESTGSYTTEFGSKREPPAGQMFLWVHVTMKNIGQRELNLPDTENFSILYGTSEFKSTYGHREGYTDYTSLKPVLYQGQEVDAWLRFDIPVSAELTDLWFAFLPESSQLGGSFSLTARPWGDHPVYLWTLAP